MPVRSFRLMPVLLLVAAMGCTGKDQSAPGRSGDRIPAEQRAEDAAAATRAARPQPAQKQPSAATDSPPPFPDLAGFAGGIVLAPRRIASWPPLRETVAAALDQYPDLWLIDPRTVEQVVVLIAPMTEQQVAALFGHRSAEKTEQQAPPTPAEDALGPTVPELDYLFVGLEPEPADQSSALDPILSRRALERDLSRWVPPFALGVLQFTDEAAAQRLVSRLREQFAFAGAETDGQLYYRQDLPQSPGADNPVAFYRQGRTLVLGCEQMLTSTIGQGQPRLAKALRQLRYRASNYSVVGLLRLEGIHNGISALLEPLLKNVDPETLDPAHLWDTLNKTRAVFFFVELGAAGLMQVRINSLVPVEQMQPTVRSLCSEMANHTMLKLQRWRQDHHPLRQLYPLISQLLGGLRVVKLRDRVVVQLGRPGISADDLRPLAAWTRTAAVGWWQTARLRRIGTALLDYYQLNGRLPDNGPWGIGGYPVSWRVKLLPYLGAAELLDQYDFNEPWDGPHNQKLLGQMPAVYGPEGPNTSVLALTGPGTILENPDEGLSHVRDAPEQVVVVVQAGPQKAVPWTRPADLELAELDPAAPLGSPPEGGFAAVMLDGSVRRLSSSIDPARLRQLADPADGLPAEQNQR